MWQLVEVKGAQLLGHQIQRLRQGLLKFHFFYCCQVTKKIEYFHSVVSSKASRSDRKILYCCTERYSLLVHFCPLGDQEGCLTCVWTRKCNFPYNFRAWFFFRDFLWLAHIGTGSSLALCSAVSFFVIWVVARGDHPTIYIYWGPVR